MTVLMAAAIAIVSTTIPTNDHEQLQGSFEARLDRNPFVNLNVTTEENGYSNWGASVGRSELREIRVDDGRISFKLTRPAGTFSMEGKGTEAKARGTFDFFPSETFRQQLASLGFTGLTNERMFIFAMGDLTLADVRYIDQLTSDELTTTQLVKMVQHGVTEEFVKGMADAGFKNLRSSELITARDHGVTPHYVSNLQKFGYDLSLKEYIRAKDSGVSEGRLLELREQGYDMLTLEQLIVFRGRRH